MRKRPLCMGCLLFVIAIAICLKSMKESPPDYSDWEGKQVFMTGQVTSIEELVSTQGPVTVIYIRRIPSENSSPGFPRETIMCYLLKTEQRPRVGSIVKICGTLRLFEKATNPGQFHQAEYYQILDITCKLNKVTILQQSVSYHPRKEMLWQVRRHLSGILDACLPPEEASIMKTMLLGEKGQIDREIKGLYQRNGIAHILAISGLHISMLGMGLFRMLRRIYVPVPLAAASSVVMMLLYGEMTGMGTSTTRALIMFLLHMTGLLIGRTYDLLTALFLAAVWILLEQPLYLRHSGFLFSFGAVLSIGMLMPVMLEGITDKIRFLRPFITSISTSILSFPIYLYFYYQFPLYSIGLNLLVIPLMSLVMALGIALMLAGNINLALSGILAIPECGILWLYEKAGMLCDQLPYSNLILGKPEKWQVIFYLGICIVLVILPQLLGVLHSKWEKKEEYLPLMRWSLLVVAVSILSLRFESGLQMTFLDVGQGDCIYIRSESGKHYLIDGGSSTAYQVGKYRITPFLKSQGAASLEAVFVTHPDEDHMNGVVELLEQLETDGVRIKQLILPDVAPDNRNEGYLQLLELAAKQKVMVVVIHAGQQIKDGKMVMTCLHPEEKSTLQEPNAYSTVLYVTYGDFSALLTGDVEGTGESQLTECLREYSIEPLTMLKVAHHGSNSSSTEAFLAQIQPLYGVISCGAQNKYGHPHAEVLKRMKIQGTEWLRTDESGAITVMTDGEQLEIKTFIENT